MSLSSYLILGAALFAIGVVGIFLNRRNVIVILFRNLETVNAEELDSLKG